MARRRKGNEREEERGKGGREEKEKMRRTLVGGRLHAAGLGLALSLVGEIFAEVVGPAAAS